MVQYLVENPPHVTFRLSITLNSNIIVVFGTTVIVSVSFMVFSLWKQLFATNCLRTKSVFLGSNKLMMLV